MKSSLVERAPILEGLPPTGDAGAQVLILGSFPSEASLRAQQYYAHPRNNFWTIMSALFGFGSTDGYDAGIAALTAHGVAVWDVIGRCRRAGSMDHAIQDPEANDVIGWLDRHPNIRGVALNGGKAAETARRNVPGLFARSGLRVRRMPSTSPANASIPMTDKMRAWAEIKEWLRDA
jgi:hypoxanthine-DNA glycosylase